MRVDDILNEKTKQRLDPKCWDGYKKQGTKMKGGVRVNNCVKEDVPVEENGLQRYTGIKKYGKKGFEALQKAGREGASEEQKGAIKDKYLKKESVELEETYDGDDFFEAYGVMYFNEDEQIDEAEYQGRKVSLGKPTRGDVKKFKVYVKNPKGNVVKVNFGDPNMKIRKSNPKARKSFRARHNCDNPGPRHKARYWSCRKW
tara:strand:+ start:1815 stop:2417 length:603 start_codon:yes stop_codon:yes gene_type:complete